MVEAGAAVATEAVAAEAAVMSGATVLSQFRGKFNSNSIAIYSTRLTESWPYLDLALVHRLLLLKVSALFTSP